MNNPHEEIVGLYRQGKYQEALPLARQACETTKGSAEANPLALAQNFNLLGNIYRELGHYSKAEQPYLQALKIQQPLLGKSHPHYAQSLNDLAKLYEVTGQYGQAQPLFQQAMSIR